MTIVELYNTIGADYNDVASRFGNEKIIIRFIPLFLKDPSYDQLTTAIDSGDWESAFRAAHTMKGASANMGFNVLSASASALTEHLRGNKPLTDRALLDRVSRDYTATINAINDFLANQEM